MLVMMMTMMMMMETAKENWARPSTGGEVCVAHNYLYFAFPAERSSAETVVNVFDCEARRRGRGMASDWEIDYTLRVRQSRSGEVCGT